MPNPLQDNPEFIPVAFETISEQNSVTDRQVQVGADKNYTIDVGGRHYNNNTTRHPLPGRSPFNRASRLIKESRIKKG